MNFNFTISLFVLCCAVRLVNAADMQGIPEFVDEMVNKHQFKRDELERVFNHVQHKPSVIAAISRPATIRPWLEYRASFVNNIRIQRGLEFWRKHAVTLQRAEKQFGVPQEIIVAIIGVETIYGKNAGTFRTIDALATLAFDYPRRAPFFRSELENYLLLAQEQQFDLLETRSSYAGALGIPQFMPSSYRKYAVDFNGNNKIDLLHENDDAIGSVGNYMKGYGWIGNANAQPQIAAQAKLVEKNWITDMKKPRSLREWSLMGVAPHINVPPDQAARLADYTVTDGKEYWLLFNNFEVITRYNNSDFYAMSVFLLAEKLKAARKVTALN